MDPHPSAMPKANMNPLARRAALSASDADGRTIRVESLKRRSHSRAGPDPLRRRVPIAA